jgi:hypothetical protein
MRTSNVHEFAGILEDFDAPAIEASDAPAPHHARRVREAAAALRSLATERDEALDVLRQLVDALPKCYECGKPATRHGPNAEKWCDRCDEHGCDPFRSPTDYRRAAPLREAIALLERHGGSK